ncbi:MAG: ROK family protein [Alphaproteobacteria bacterium]|nr:ROK family protein [Alphaproteobacteria bacterium]
MKSDAALRLGVDLGGTKMEVIALGPDGREMIRRRRDTPRGDYRAIVEAIAGLVRSVEAEVGAGGSIGIGIPGTISPATGRVKNANTTELIDHPLDRDLAAELGRPVRMANDADCFALSEAMDGAGRGARSVFGVILGTGVGGGLVFEGKLIGGPNSIAGEWGHNPLPWPTDDERPGRACYCGKSGCIETFLSGPGFAADHLAHTGQRLTGPAIAAAAEAGDPAAQASVERYVERLARALATVINIFDPEVVVLGGGMSNLKAIYRRVPEIWPKWVLTDRVDTRLAPPVHGDSSGVRGAAWLWPVPA